MVKVFQMHQVTSSPALFRWGSAVTALLAPDAGTDLCGSLESRGCAAPPGARGYLRCHHGHPRKQAMGARVPEL